MKKTKQLIIKVNKNVYSKLQELKHKNVNVANIVTNVLVNAKSINKYTLCDTNLMYSFHLR